ncbi:hypothetical protein OAS39_10355, partial [Pirellulales bacterium]|nr:hypothetical protein [Pirellulales bacterium]
MGPRKIEYPFFAQLLWRKAPLGQMRRDESPRLPTTSLSSSNDFAPNWRSKRFMEAAAPQIGNVH